MSSSVFTYALCRYCMLQQRYQLAIAICLSLAIFIGYNQLEEWYKRNTEKQYLATEIGVIGRSLLCGCVLGFAVYQLFWCDNLSRIQRPSTFIAMLAMFHYTEFLFTAISNPIQTNERSFLIEYGCNYWFANILSLIEYAVGELLFSSHWRSFIDFHNLMPSLNVVNSLSHHIRHFVSLKNLIGSLSEWCFFIGLILVLLGEIIRKMAMLNAGRSFYHILQNKLPPEHKLITSGLYSVCRHPSYLGWFLWQLGMQLILSVPICTITHSLVTLKFFSERINYEESILINTFGNDYIKYMRCVRWTGVPFI
ncbi:hypothetical protein GJ496_007903 [Pomphorhynchus laevis]|nr:hypothetical protein GJ496_007903 [Pomphorhynchus laevis]